MLAVANAVVFVLLSFGGMTEDAGYMLEHGAMYTPYILENQEYYRMFTCLFLHFGFEHLMNNLVVLIIMGKYLEPIIGSVRFVILYLFAGLGGNVLSLVFEMRTEDYAVSAGASGAIFGLMGALLALVLLGNAQEIGISKRGMIFMIALNLYNGFVSEGVDNFAHIGGAVCGFLLALLLGRKRYVKACSFAE